jgi:hypothetical protein
MEHQGAAAFPDHPEARMRATTMTAVLAVLGTALLAYKFRHFYVDDAYIGFRYVSNLLAGHGLVFNPGERVEGITNLGWLLFLTPLAAALGAPLAAKSLGMGLTALCAGLTAAAAWRLAPAGGRQWLAPLAAVLVLAQFDFSYFALAGMETGLVAALLLIGLHLVLGGRMTLAAGVAVLAFTSRPEAVVVFPLAVIVLGLLGPGRRRDLVVPTAVFALGVAAVTAARYAYFGDWIPNTFHAKVSGLGQGLLSVINPALPAPWNLPYPFGGLFVWVVLAAGAAAAWRRHAPGAAMVLATMAAGYFFARYAGPDWTGGGRYFAPYLPAGVVLLLLGGVAIERRFLPRFSGASPWLTMSVGLAVALGGAVSTLYMTSPSRLTIFPGYVMTTQPLLGPAEWLRDNLPADAVIASRRIGLLAYVTERPVFDYFLGLTDREVAAAVERAGHRFSSPNDPGLATLWSARRPDYLMEDSDVIERIVDESGGTPDRFLIHGLAYRVIKRFPIGERQVEGLFERQDIPIDWTLAERIETP